MQYRGFTIQDFGNSYIVRDIGGMIVAEFPTIAEAQDWIDESIDR